jgi:hypothetical protein
MVQYGRLRYIHPRQRYFREVRRWENDVTEMTLLQTTVFQRETTVEISLMGMTRIITQPKPVSRKLLLGFFYLYDLTPCLTEVRVEKMVNEAPKTIASFAPNRLRARLLSVGLRDRGTQNIGMRYFC